MMKNLTLKMRIFMEFVISIACFYFGITMSFTSLFVNLIILFAGIFLLMQALGNIDILNGYNQENSNTQKNDYSDKE